MDVDPVVLIPKAHRTQNPDLGPELVGTGIVLCKFLARSVICCVGKGKLHQKVTKKSSSWLFVAMIDWKWWQKASEQDWVQMARVFIWGGRRAWGSSSLLVLPIFPTASSPATSQGSSPSLFSSFLKQRLQTKKRNREKRLLIKAPKVICILPNSCSSFSPPLRMFFFPSILSVPRRTPKQRKLQF